MGILKQNFIKPEVAQIHERDSIVKAVNIGVKYAIGIKREDLQSRIFSNLLRRKKKKELWALKDVSFAGCSGDILGIIGNNGAGKTTLCRVISGLLRPDTGKIRVNGKVSALLTLGAGFNQTLTGRENIFLNAMMLGFSKRYVKEIFHDIVDFSGLGHFIDEPMKNYSSGMKSRLGFSIAAMIEPEILILDEALSAGDLEFSEKAGKKLQQLIYKSKIVIVVSHQLNFIEKYCTRGIWINDGLIRTEGHPKEVVRLYKESIPKTTKKVRIVNFQKTESISDSTGIIKAKNLGLKFLLSADHDANADNTDGNKRTWRKRKKSFWALKDINFTVNVGEIVGVIGRNGAGKTTLCRLISGILKPDRGNIFIKGQTTALLSFGAGFNIQLTGRDNVYLNGMMLGIPKKELRRIYSDIVEFSGLGHFINEPVKNYSSGMKSRLGFSIAAMIKPDVFVLDEALSTGDIAFYEKASTKIQNLITIAKSVIVVTHSMAFVEKVCTRAIWIDDGIVKFDGSSKQAVEVYSQSVKH
ncbi:MAG: ATP-binding cassette domain-containing protein [Thermodesulfobacteriota bacterium]|nr:ATP-binding cassette domain-containing protein [Thermodesulfobacteriota bacterium]